MNNEPYRLGERTLTFSKDILDFRKTANSTSITEPLLSQLIRSATSIGANYAEANNAASKTDFRHKIFLAKKEAAETKYWLNLLLDHIEDRKTCLRLLQECQYLLMIFQKIINTLNHGKRFTVNAK